MSREHSKRFQRGIKQPLGDRIVRARKERHGKPVVVRKRTVVTDPETNLVTIKHELVPCTEARTVRVAVGPTGTYGQKNTGGTKAGVKSAKPNE